MQLTGEQLVKSYRSLCTIQEFEGRVHKEFTSGQILGFAHPHASKHRGHGYSTDKGGAS